MLCGSMYDCIFSLDINYFMKKTITHTFANTTSHFLKVVLHTEAHANSTFFCFEPQVPESLFQFKKDLAQKKK